MPPPCWWLHRQKHQLNCQLRVKDAVKIIHIHCYFLAWHMTLLMPWVGEGELSTWEVQDGSRLALYQLTWSEETAGKSLRGPLASVVYERWL